LYVKGFYLASTFSLSAVFCILEKLMRPFAWFSFQGLYLADISPTGSYRTKGLDKMRSSRKSLDFCVECGHDNV
jgi:hypothetical protein